MGLGLSVLVLLLGVVIMVLAIFTRNQLDSETLVYSYLGSLIKRKQKQEEKINEMGPANQGKRKRLKNENLHLKIRPKFANWMFIR